jgi:hypothetical protein
MAKNPTAPGAGADHLGYPDDDMDEFEDVDIKEALGLPDSLPPIRLSPAAELVARARSAPLPGQLAALAAWVGEDGREVTDDGELAPRDLAGAAGALGVEPGDLAYLWEYALAVDWLVFDEDEDDEDEDEDEDYEDRVVPGETAADWAGTDQAVLDAWSATLAAVLGETLLVAGPDDDDDWDRLGLGDLDFTGQATALAVLLFLARREGLSVADFTEVLWENASGDQPDEQAARARATWEQRYGDPARLLLGKLGDLRAVTVSGDIIRLTPLALAVLRDQLVEAGVEIPLLPPTAAELTGAQLLAMAEGIGDDEFEAEADEWVAARGPDAAARELLQLAADGGPGERMLAVAAVTRIGAAAGPAWRDSLDVPEVRAYAKLTLAGAITTAGGPDGLDGRGGADLPPGLEPLPDDLAWVATDMLALACDDEFPDPGELAAAFREAVPAGQEAALFDAMGRSEHPDVVDVLNHVGRYHPDKQIAKAARTAAHRAVSRRASHS